MSENNNHIDSSSFKKYFSDKMDSDEKIVFEKSIENDDFEKEAFEGFQSVDKNKANAAMLDIEDRISAKTNVTFGETKSISLLRPLAIAASIVFLFGSVFIISKMLKSDETTLADNSIQTKKTAQEETEVTQVEKIEEAEAISENEDVVTNVETPFIEEEVVEVEDVRNTFPKEDIPEIIEEKTVVSEPEPIEVKAIVENDEAPTVMADNIVEEAEEVQVSKNRSVTTTSAKLDDTDKNTSGITKPPNVKVVESNNFKNGKVNYTNRNFTVAIEDFEKSLNEQKNIAESNYYIAMSYYQLEKYNKALISFDNVISSKSSLRNNALWYKSLVLLNQGRKTEAKGILEDMASGNSTFKNPAIEKLKTID